MVAYTEFVVQRLAFFIFEAYDNLRVRVVSRTTCGLAVDITLEPILDNMENVNEAMRIIQAVETTRFDTLP